MNKGWEELGAGIWNPELTTVMVAQGIGLDWVAETDSGICVANPFSSSGIKRKVVHWGEESIGGSCCYVNNG